MENREGNKKITAEDVISKLKDDGDFDSLRLKIIRKLKDNEALRNSVISAIKQSEALNRPGAENMKPRQLSDAIHEEIRSKVMAEISDGLWEIIRSSNGMKTEIMETVQSVYNKLVNPKGKEANNNVSVPYNKEANASGIPSSEENTSINDQELPPGFHGGEHFQANANQGEHKNALGFSPSKRKRYSQEEHKDLPFLGQQPHDEAMIEQPNAVSDAQMTDDGPKSILDGSDEDPDVPPGFG